MNGLLFSLFLVLAGPQNTGAVTGIVRGANGMPAPGIRVYAMAVRDATEAAIAGTAIESQAQTDASGRYRLDVAAGRYYIASGSVGAPTYYPGTTNVASARVISITAGGLVESIDFSSFVPASRTPTGFSIPPLPPGSTGVLQGTIRFPDGTPAPGMTVVAVPTAASAGTGTGGTAVSIRTGTAVPVITIANSIYFTTTTGAAGVTAATRMVINGYNIVQARTDASGRYRLENIPPETYYLATGFSDAPVLFPGTADTLVAKTFTTTPTTSLDALDFTVPRQAMGVPISGRVTALGGAPAVGATVQIIGRPTASSNSATFFLPSRNRATPGIIERVNVNVPVKADGTFEAPGVLPGTYSVEARMSGTAPATRSITVTDQPVTGIEFALPVAMLSGRILLGDGSPLPNPQVFAEAIVTTVNNPIMTASTVLPISSDGTFTRLLEADEYRFYLRNLPDEYTITSITSGTQDLLKETLKATRTASVSIDVRVALRTGPSNANDVKVSGRVLDNMTGIPASAERVTLCCLDSGPSERFSTPLRLDGSFEFAGVPRGRYELGLQAGTGQPKLFPVDSRVEVAASPVSGLTFLSAPQFAGVMAAIVFENGTPLPATASTSVVFTGALGRARVAAQHNGDVGYYASVPAGDQYSVSVTSLPEGYIVKSISGSVDVPRSQTGTSGRVPVLPPTAPITITIAPSATQPAR